MEREPYDCKINLLLDEGNYTRLKQDPTKTIERRIRSILWTLVGKGELNTDIYQRLRPEHCPAPYLYGLRKIHKVEVPLRPIVSTIRSPTYALAKELTRVISPLAGNTSSYVKDAAHFVQIMEDKRTDDNTTMVSFDVKSLFMNVPMDKALHFIRDKLEQDTTLEERTALNIESILDLST